MITPFTHNQPQLPGFLLLLSALALLQPPDACGQVPDRRDVPPKREVRAVWVATVAGLDWPSSTNPAEQQQSLLRIVDELAKARYNTIFFQVRGRADAMYRSSYEPWAQHLTGRLGGDPGWDPLAFVIEAAHARGMEVHAWFNALLAKSGRDKPPESTPRHVILRHPEWLYPYQGEWWFDPGTPEVRQYLIDVGLDIIRRYDIDGLHLDFIRYAGRDINDDASYKRFGASQPRDGWRRGNINTLVSSLYDSAVAIKPRLKIGSAPIGIARNVGGIKGWEAYDELYQDARRWLREGVHDYLAPQIYWPITSQPGAADFGILVRDWCDHASGRHVYPGIGAYKPEVCRQLPRLVDTSRTLGAKGNAFFRYESIRGVLGISGRYRFPAFIPPMPWKDSVPPFPPSNLILTGGGDGVVNLTWLESPPAPDGDHPAYYAVYRSAFRPVDVNDPASVVAVVPSSVQFYSDTIHHAERPRLYYAVSAFDRGHNESRPTSEAAAVLPEIVELSRVFSLRDTLLGAWVGKDSRTVFVAYELRTAGPVIVQLLDAGSNEIISIVDGIRPSGRHVSAASVESLPSGSYGTLFVAGEHVEKRMLSVGR